MAGLGPMGHLVNPDQNKYGFLKWEKTIQIAYNALNMPIDHHTGAMTHMTIN